MKRKIVNIDEGRCDGCGLCASACAEGAIQIVNGKAKLVSDTYCDGLGACLGECPRDAITIEEREASAFDEKAVHEHLEELAGKTKKEKHAHSGCPGMAVMTFGKESNVSAKSNSKLGDGRDACPPLDSELSQWPVQLHLVPTVAPYWDNADLLVSADCVPFAFPDFHRKLLKGKKLLIACPKLDDTDPYLEKLTAIFRENRIRSVTVARMEVPCCGGIVMIAKRALQESGKQIPFSTVTVSIRGEIIE